jgi:hypothetical protein
MKFKIALKKRNTLYKRYIRMYIKTNKLREKIIQLEHICVNKQKMHDKFDRKFPISVNFSGWED